MTLEIVWILFLSEETILKHAYNISKAGAIEKPIRQAKGRHRKSLEASLWTTHHTAKSIPPQYTQPCINTHTHEESKQ